MTEGLAPMLETCLVGGVPVMLVTIARARGSTPREGGARMLVTATAQQGTIGGGSLEWAALAEARRLLAAGALTGRLEVPLGPAIGQCCGGHVHLELTLARPSHLRELHSADAAATMAMPVVALFGAGHVGKALAQALSPLPVRVRWLDSRQAEFPTLVPDGIEAVVTGDVTSEVRALPPGAAVLAMTHSHGIDFEIVAAALARDNLAYVGVIGSATKRARFVHGLEALGLSKARIARLVCPIGRKLSTDKRPAVIAALVAAELLVTLGAAADASAMLKDAAA